MKPFYFDPTQQESAIDDATRAAALRLTEAFEREGVELDLDEFAMIERRAEQIAIKEVEANACADYEAAIDVMAEAAMEC